MELSKYIKGEHIQLSRSQVKLADYNPRVISVEAKKRIKRGIKRYGMVDEFIVNKTTGNTIVGGHQRLTILDELQKYDGTEETDYIIPVSLIEVDETQEKELNILLNNTSAQGEFDWDALRAIMPTIDYQEIGFSDSDLSFIGVDYTVQTEGEAAMADALADMYAPAQEAHDAEVAQRKEEREAQRAVIKEAQAAATGIQDLMEEEEPFDPEKDREARVEHMKQVKAEVKAKTQADADNMMAYVTLSFSSFKNKKEFMQRFGYSPDKMFLKGEEFSERCEVIYDEDEEEYES